MSITRQIAKVLESVVEQDYVIVAPVKDAGISDFVGEDLKAAIADPEKRVRAAAADLEFEETARLRDDIRRPEALDIGLEPPPLSSASLRPGHRAPAVAATIRASAAGEARCAAGGHDPENCTGEWYRKA